MEAEALSQLYLHPRPVLSRPQFSPWVSQATWSQGCHFEVVQMQSLKAECVSARVNMQAKVSEAMGMSCVCVSASTHINVWVLGSASHRVRGSTDMGVCLCCPDVTIQGCVCVCTS